MTERLVGKTANGEKVNMDDILSRNEAIKLMKEVYNIDIYSNPMEKEIDLLYSDGRRGGIEVERGNWIGNLLHPENFGLAHACRKGDPPIHFATVNFSDRKEHYWENGYHERFHYTEVNKDYNIFIRFSHDFTEAFILMPEIINDSKKRYYSYRQAERIRKNREERWSCFKVEDAIRVHKVNGVWTLSK